LPDDFSEKRILEIDENCFAEFLANFAPAETSSEGSSDIDQPSGKNAA